MTPIRKAEYRSMPWKNGKGTTVEIARHEKPGNDGFIWRVSIADVSESGPFSNFPGIDRNIMVVEGNGMMLEAEGHGSFSLERPFVPVTFSGDWNVRGDLKDGPVRDFNLMVDRSVASGQLTVLDTPSDHETLYQTQADTVLVHALTGRVAIRTNEGTLTLEHGDSSIAQETAHTGGFTIRAMDENTVKLAVVEVTLRN